MPCHTCCLKLCKLNTAGPTTTIATVPTKRDLLVGLAVERCHASWTSDCKQAVDSSSASAGASMEDRPEAFEHPAA